MTNEEPHPDFNPEEDHVVRIDPEVDVPEEEEHLTPYRVAAQLKMFKSGLLGTAVQVYSSYKGGYGPSPIIMAVDGKTEPVTIRVTDEAIEDQVHFAGGYIVGWTQSLGGDIEKLDIWLEPVDEPEKTPETYFTEKEAEDGLAE